MDPNATWRDLAQAFADDDWEKVDELTQALRHWLDRGGFAPQITGHKDI
jgi:hypothetical protein